MMLSSYDSLNYRELQRLCKTKGLKGNHSAPLSFSLSLSLRRVVLRVSNRIRGERR